MDFCTGCVWFSSNSIRFRSTVDRYRPRARGDRSVFSIRFDSFDSIAWSAEWRGVRRDDFTVFRALPARGCDRGEGF